jgi:DNA-binding PadR family transcriptional regulator
MSIVTYDMPSLITDREANVLEQLAVRNKYGLELVDESGGLLTKNAVYVLLTRMESKNFIVSHEVAAPRGQSGPPRWVYRLTTLGRRVLAAHRAAVKTLGEK